jgi:hypothetical protein
MSTQSHSQALPAWQVASDDGRNLRVALDGDEYHVLRLTWAERTRAIHSAVDIAGGAVELRPTAFSRGLLAASLVAVEREHGPEPITPAWLDSCPARSGDRLLEVVLHINGRKPLGVEERGAGGDAVEVVAAGACYELVPWTWGARNRALESAAGGTERSRVDAASFYEAALRAMCVAIDGEAPPMDWVAALQADVGDALLSVALRMSGLDDRARQDIVHALRMGLPHEGVALYTLCKEFGWTPAQVRTQSAVDIDTLLAAHRAWPQTTSQAMPPHAAVGQRAHDPPSSSRHGTETIILITDDDTEKQA